MASETRQLDNSKGTRDVIGRAFRISFRASPITQFQARSQRSRINQTARNGVRFSQLPRLSRPALGQIGGPSPRKGQGSRVPWAPPHPDGPSIKRPLSQARCSATEKPNEPRPLTLQPLCAMKPSSTSAEADRPPSSPLSQPPAAAATEAWKVAQHPRVTA